MNDLEGAVREMLSRKAAAQPPVLDMPGSVRSRVRRRLAWNSMAVGASLVVITIGVVAGLRGLGASSPPKLPRSDDSAPAECTDLQATFSLEGAAGSREGVIFLTNISQHSCTLEGTPGVEPLDEHGDPIDRGVTFETAQAGWVVEGAPRPGGWPVVTLDPGESASVRMRWSNWCPDGRPAPSWRLTRPDGGNLAIRVNLDLASVPPCNGPGQDSTVEIGPFEPDSGRTP